MPNLIEIPDDTPFDLLWRCAWQANAIEWINRDYGLSEDTSDWVLLDEGEWSRRFATRLHRYRDLIAKRMAEEED